MIMDWTLLLLILQTSVYPALSQSSCYSGIADLQGYPLPNSADSRYNSLGQQVIVPQLRFSCLGYVSSWSAHALVLTRPNFIESLTHVMLLQVWRPSQGNESYTRVGYNVLRFQGATLRDGITPDPGTNDTAFFSFTQQVPPDQQILVQPGDVVGWFVPFITPTPPLSPLFRDPILTDTNNVVGDILYQNISQQGCTFCSSNDYGVIPSTVPLVSATVNSPSQDDTCTQMDQVCNITTTTEPTVVETTPTPTDTPTASPASTGGQLTSAESICIAIACITLILHTVIIILCAANLAAVTGIKKALKSRTVTPFSPAVTPGIRSPSNFQLNPIGGRRTTSPMASPAPYEIISSKTPAEYEAVHVKPPLYETVAEERRLHIQDKSGSQKSLDDQFSDSRTGSKEDLMA